MCAEFEWFEVKVPLTFCGTGGFARPRDGRYSGMLLSVQTLATVLVEVLHYRVKYSSGKIHMYSEFKRLEFYAHQFFNDNSINKTQSPHL